MSWKFCVEYDLPGGRSVYTLVYILCTLLSCLLVLLLLDTCVQCLFGSRSRDLWQEEEGRSDEMMDASPAGLEGRFLIDCFGGRFLILV